MKRVALILLFLTSVAHAADTRSLKCRMLPNSPGCKAPVSVPIEPPPVVVAPPAPAAADLPPVQQAPLVAPAPVAPTIIAPPVVAPVVRALPPRKKAVRPVVKQRKKEPRAHKLKKEAKAKRAKAPCSSLPGPGLVWSCSLVRWHTAGKSRKQLIAEGREKGIKPSKRQICEALECIGQR